MNPDLPELQRLRRAVRRRQQLRYALGIGVPIALLGVWEALAWLGAIDRRFLPAPSRIAAICAGLLATPTERAMLLHDVMVSLYRVGAGYLLGALLGIVTGIVMGLWLPLRYAVGPLIHAAYPMPKIAIFPLFIVIFGLGDGSKVALIALGVFFMTVLSTVSGVVYSNGIYRDVAAAFRLPAWTRWMKVTIPAALPSIVTGLKLGMGQAFILVVATEMISGEDGIGHFIWKSWEVLDISRMFLGLVIVAGFGLAAMLLGDLLERRLTPWAAH
jgi:ABC-type nitrate/sulfonate/bicarbonate transport system permease component